MSVRDERGGSGEEEDEDELPPYEPGLISGSSGPNAPVPPNSGLHSQRHQYDRSRGAPRRKGKKKRRKQREPHTGYTPFELDHPVGYNYNYENGYDEDRWGYLSLSIISILFILLVIISLSILGSMGREGRDL